jgi:hypothetical protein
LSFLAKFVEDADENARTLFSKEIQCQREMKSEMKVLQIFFEKAIRINQGQNYSCVQKWHTNIYISTFYGLNGLEKVEGKKDVIFTFCECFSNEGNGTTRFTGHLPEIYYYA